MARKGRGARSRVSWGFSSTALIKSPSSSLFPLPFLFFPFLCVNSFLSSLVTLSSSLLLLSHCFSPLSSQEIVFWQSLEFVLGCICRFQRKGDGKNDRMLIRRIGSLFPLSFDCYFADLDISTRFFFKGRNGSRIYSMRFSRSLNNTRKC